MCLSKQNNLWATVLVFILLSLSACGGAKTSGNNSGETDNSVDSNAIAKTTAINKIMAFAESGSHPAPTLQDYIDAGVTGVTSETLAELNSIVSALTPDEVDTTEELTALTAQLGVNIVPIANAGGNKTVQVNQSITLTGSGSDIDGNIVSYSWEKDGAVIANTASFSYSSTAVGTDTLTLTVTDDDGDTAQDSIVVVVSAEPPTTPVQGTSNQAPTANAGVNRAAQVNQTIVIVGIGADSDGTVSYAWKSGDILLATSASFSYTSAEVGSYTLTLYVTDDDGATSSDSMIVVVSAVPSNPTTNHAPTANAGGNKTALVNQSITITGSGLDSDGTVTYVWRKGSAVLATSASFLYTPTAVGTDTLTLTVTDNDGAVASDSMSVVVSAIPDTTAPVITLLGNSQITVEHESVYTDAGATALDNKDGNITQNIAVGGDAVDTSLPANTQFTITYNVADAAGNPASQVTRTVTIISAVDTIDPVITLSGGTVVEAIQNSTYVDAGATASDNKDGDITVNIVVVGDDAVNTQANPGTTFTITYNIVDAAGNPAIEVTRSVSIIADPNSGHVIPPLSATDITAYLTLINDARGTARTCGGGNYPAVSAVIWSDKLYRASYEHSQDMATSHVFTHDGSGTASDWTGVALGANHQSSVGERLATYAYAWSAYGENIAAGYSSPESVMQGWLNSPGHCANIMSSNFNQVGLARVGNYWTQDFGYSN